MQHDGIAEVDNFDARRTLYGELAIAKALDEAGNLQLMEHCTRRRIIKYIWG